MNKKLLFILLLFPVITFGQNYQGKIDSIVDVKFDNGLAVSVLISENFIPKYTKIKGNSNLEFSLLANELSKFRIGSVTKQFTAIGILKLQEEGLLNLSDSIQKYLPKFPVKNKTITIEHLLTHTSGLKEITELDVFFNQLMKNGSDPDSLVNYFKDFPLEFDPGEKFSYNNSGYHLLGLIIEKVSGLKYNRYIKTNLLDVAEMINTEADNNYTLIENRVSGYENSPNGIVNATYIDMSIPFSGGNLLSTAGDVNNWYKALFNYKIVSKISLEKAHKPFLLNNGSSSNYGYGWFIDTLQNEKIISHEGGINGFLSSVWFVPSSKTLTVILSNCSCNPTVNTAKKITAYAIGKPLAEIKKIKLERRILKKYVGTYIMNEEKWTVSLKDENLYFKFENGNGHPIYAKDKNNFFAEDWDSKFIFFEKEDGTIEFQFIYLGEKIVGIKE